jgi:predicted dehydrogenase
MARGSFADMKSVRLGLIGLGNIGRHHAEYLRAGAVPRCELTAVCSTSPQKLEAWRPAAIWDDALQLIRSGTIDAVLIATPHYQHTPLGIAAFEAGLHVMVEKPISAHKADAERLIAAHGKDPSRVFGAMFQLRMEPRYLEIRRRIQAGELGRLVRVNWINTDWFRTDAYYASGGWRATWAGEGGGVLINQCLHNLDTLAWLFGRPSKIRSFVTLGRDHTIEVEDNVTAYLEYERGATGVFVASTGEAPGTNRLEITGTLGQLILEGGRLRFTRNAADMHETVRTSPGGFTKPEATTADIPFENAVAPHAALLTNFVEAILDGAPLIAPGADGLGSIELANAMLYSGLIDETVRLPLDGDAYERKLQELIAGSRFVKKTASGAVTDFAQSFRR